MNVIKPLRVLHSVSRMDRGGAETLLMNLYRNIDRSLVQFDFVVNSSEKGTFDDEINSLGGHIYYVPLYTIGNHLQYRRAWFKLFGEHINQWKYIHGHMYSTASIYLKIAREFGISTIVHSHNTSSGKGVEALAKNILQYPLRKGASDYLFACSQAAGQWLYGEENMSKVIVLNNAIDAKTFEFDNKARAEVRGEYGVENNLVIGHVGRFHEQKNHLFLIDIFQNIYQKAPNAILWLLGRGPLEKMIQQRVAELGLANAVRFMGVRSDIPVLMQAMDVFLLPSLFEGLPVTLIEAQASGLPCFVSDVITEEVRVTDLVTFISLQENPARWADIIMKGSTGFIRRKTYHEIRNAAYDIKTIAAWLQDFYVNKIPMDAIDLNKSTLQHS